MKLKHSLLTILFIFGFGVVLLGMNGKAEAATLDKLKIQYPKKSSIKAVNINNEGIAQEAAGAKNLLGISSTIFTVFQANGINAITGGPESLTYGKESITDAGAIGGVGRAISTLMGSPAASGQTYVADLLYNAKFLGAPPVYAQIGGLGFSSLEPILEAWKQFRNIAYMFFIIITIVIGFMIMMRQKIGGQAAVTAQQAIPNIVIALIAVTFSYAIAGFLIDFMYLIMYLLVGLFPAQISTSDISSDIFSLGGKIFKAGLLKNAALATQDLVADTVTDFKGDIAGGLAGLTFAFIVALAFLFALISLFFELLKTYVAIIISIILAPLLLMMGALPGRKDIFKGWVMSIIGNLMAFPVVLLLLVMYKLLTKGSAAEGGFLPPYLVGRGSGDALTLLIGLAIMLISKDLVVQAKKAINPKGSGIFEQFGGALSTAVSKGWTGGQLVPGLGFTDTNKLPGIKHIGSGKSLMTNLGSTAAGVGGGLLGGYFTPKGAKIIGAKKLGGQYAQVASSKLGGTLYQPKKPTTK